MRIIINPKYIRIFAKPKCPTMLRPMTYLLPSFSHPSFTDEESSCEAFGRRFCESKSSEHYGFFLGLNFTGKETDCETGFSYFGARYYDPTLLTSWTAVDPMSDKYPNISPYAYCAWNPMKLVDLDGKEDEIPPFLAKFCSAERQAKSFMNDKENRGKYVRNPISSIDSKNRETITVNPTTNNTGSFDDNIKLEGITLPTVEITATKSRQFTDGDIYNFFQNCRKSIARVDDKLTGSADGSLSARLDKREVISGLNVLMTMSCGYGLLEAVGSRIVPNIISELVGCGMFAAGNLSNNETQQHAISTVGTINDIVGFFGKGKNPAGIIGSVVSLSNTGVNHTYSRIEKEQKRK